MITVGVTGGIGSGKSIICEIFQTLRVPIYNADLRAKHLMQFDDALKTEIKNVFGEESYKNETLNRDFLAKQIFANGDQIEKLNSIVHPVVKIDFDSWTKIQKNEYVIKEAALLIETGSYKDLDYLIVVSAPEKTRVSRVLKRDLFRTQEELQEILSKQTSDDIRTNKADFFINNDGSSLVIPQVLNIHERIISSN
ncbi:MAG: dephospho-CoA kinase [Reichenbachiella sp.]